MESENENLLPQGTSGETNARHSRSVICAVIMVTCAGVGIFLGRSFSILKLAGHSPESAVVGLDVAQVMNNNSAMLPRCEQSVPFSDGRQTLGPDYCVDPDMLDRGKRKGRHFTFTMPLAQSSFYDGMDASLDPPHARHGAIAERHIYVYIPAAYEDGTEAPILVLQDGPGMAQWDSPLQLNFTDPGRWSINNAMDNLIGSTDPNRRLPPFIAIAVENGGEDDINYPGCQRNVEYDTVSDKYVRFIDEEVLPAVLNNADIKAVFPGIAFTRNPQGRAAMGCSSGGSSVFSMGWFRPDLFGLIGAFSPSFVDLQLANDPEAEKAYPLGAAEYVSHQRLIENTPKKNLRVFLQASEHDMGTEGGGCFSLNYPTQIDVASFGNVTELMVGNNWLEAGQKADAALRAKGYSTRYVYSLDTCHCDPKVLAQTVVHSLVWLWREYV